MTTHEFRAQMENLIEQARATGLSDKEVFEAIQDVYWEAIGRVYLDDHYQGEVPPRLTVPFRLPELTLNRLSIRAVNAFIQRTQARAPAFGHYEGFFYPLDMIAHWNRGYGVGMKAPLSHTIMNATGLVLISLVGVILSFLVIRLRRGIPSSARVTWKKHGCNLLKH